MKDQKSSQVRRRYDAEFKKNVLQMVEDGRSVASVSQALGIKEGLIYNWRSKAKKKKKVEKGQGGSVQIKALEKRIKELEEERDILKKALSIFSRST